jgi:hypothetical protein
MEFKQPHSRHCEPSRRKAPPDDRLREAIHASQKKMDCFVASAPRNDVEAATLPRSRSMIRPSFSINVAPR